MTPAETRYWHAEGLILALRDAFDTACGSSDTEGMREAYYHLAYFHARTRAICRRALDGGQEPLLRAALHNLIALQEALQAMHRAAPHVVPGTISRLREAGRRLIDDLIIQALQDSGPLPASALSDRVSRDGFLADIREPVARAHIGNLVASGHVVEDGGVLRRTVLPYTADNFDELGLRSLFSEPLAEQFEQAGFHGIADVTAREQGFRTLFRDLTGTSDDTAVLFVAAARAVAEPDVIATFSGWRHTDLLRSPYPRAYQRDAFALFRSRGYRGQVIEAPAGSGKTFIGMLCIQDWLRSLVQGETILVLVPTMNDQQQWVRELCIKPAGLRLPLSLVYGGTPLGVEPVYTQAGAGPCVLVLTYAALSHMGSGVGKGGFDRDSIETFLQGNSVQYIILDEAHKIVEDQRSLAARITGVFIDWLRDGSLRGLIGLTGTAAAFRERFSGAGLELASVVPERDLIAQGFVAPFAEFGVPFAYSDRERRIHDLLDNYKAGLRAFARLLTGRTLRSWFAGIPVSERLAAARDLLGMYARRADRNAAIAHRLAGWETGGELLLPEMPLVPLIQLARGWSDEQMVAEACRSNTASASEVLTGFRSLHATMLSLRSELRGLIRDPRLAPYLAPAGFGTFLDLPSLRNLAGLPLTDEERRLRARQLLATTMAGLYMALRPWYAQQGEGRTQTVRAVIEAEQASRPVHGVIVYDTAQRLRTRDGIASASARGVAGVFAELLGRPGIQPAAVLSSEIYLPCDPRDRLSSRIACYIRRVIMAQELTDAFFSLLTEGLDPSEAQARAIRESVDTALRRYADGLGAIRAPRPAEFRRAALAALGRSLRCDLLQPLFSRLQARLRDDNPHLRAWIGTFFDYALIAASIERAPAVSLEGEDGRRHTVTIVSMPAGHRKSFLYELAGRMIDAPEVPVNTAIVSAWARTGWNVIVPDLLIDATATRDVTAWRQLRGRAMRATPAGPEGGSTEPPLTEAASALLPDASLRVQNDGLSEDAVDGDGALWESVQASGRTHGLGAARSALAVELVVSHNKVAHVYELVKASGANVQVRWDRKAREWCRRQPVAAKHQHELAVSPLTGDLIAGPAHAPLLYASDPRHDLPDVLRSHLQTWLPGRDQIVAAGWLPEI